MDEAALQDGSAQFHSVRDIGQNPIWFHFGQDTIQVEMKEARQITSSLEQRRLFLNPSFHPTHGRDHVTMALAQTVAPELLVLDLALGLV